MFLPSTREGRLAVVELKADEDIHLPLQGLDYWSRVAWHQTRGEFQRFGYFRGRELSDEPPLLFLVAPGLHVHPATDILLRYISPKIEWELVGIDERWRGETCELSSGRIRLLGSDSQASRMSREIPVARNYFSFHAPSSLRTSTNCAM